MTCGHNVVRGISETNTHTLPLYITTYRGTDRPRDKTDGGNGWQETTQV